MRLQAIEMYLEILKAVPLLQEVQPGGGQLCQWGEVEPYS